MHFPSVLEKYGATRARLREIFTSSLPERLKDDASDEDKKRYERQKKDNEIRKRIEHRAWSRMLSGIETNARTARIWQAVDMAWDAAPIQKEMVPLLLWAQGKIKVDQLLTSLNDSVGESGAKKFISKTNDGYKVDIPRIFEVNINIVRSYLTRRLAAVDALWSNLWPLYKYTPRGYSTVAQLKGDIVTQRIDQMADQYGYRHQGSQWRRDMLLYGDSLVFPRAAWDKKHGWRWKKTNDGSEPTECESYITREGVDLVNPHKTRRYYDTSAPLAQINTDNGPKWVGYWDILRYGELKSCESSYFNLKDVVATADWTTLVGKYPDFFGYYFDPCVLKWPDCNSTIPGRWNDRSETIGKYNDRELDQGVLVGQHFECINPKEEGICEYDADVWLRLSVGGSGTIIGAEFMPSLPAAYGAINVNDSRLVNQSMASELLPYQDQLTNIVTHMLQQLRTSFTLLYLLDKDSLDENIRKQLESNAANRDWWLDPVVLTYSASKLKELGISDPSMAFRIIQPQIQGTIANALQAINQLLNLADRLMILSPNELGQPNPREVAAREVQEISTSVQSIYSFINQGPREQIAAVKEMLFESLVTHGSPIVRVPVMRKYTLQTIRDAGFDVRDVELSENDEYVPVETPIEGPLNELVYDYYFDSREGSERAINTQGAQALVQLFQLLTGNEAIAQKLGFDRILQIVNAVIRMSGAPLDMQIESNDGESDEIAPQQPPAPQGQPPGDPAVIQAMQALEARQARSEAVLQQFMQQMGMGPGNGRPAAPTNGAPIVPMNRGQMAVPA